MNILIYPEILNNKPKAIFMLFLDIL